MKLVRYQSTTEQSYGVLENDQVSELSKAPFNGLHYTGKSFPLKDVQLLAPVAPPNVLAIGLNYRKHAEESGSKLPDHPLLFIKANTSVIAHETPVCLPAIAPQNVDYEAELAIVIGQTARHVSPANALEFVLGYTCANDISARDCQLKLDGQWARGKSFDTFCPLGPWIETELDPADLNIRSKLNGKIMQDSTTADLIFNCQQLIAHLSTCMTLLPGTVIITGTPAGVGMARQPPRFLQPGDVIEVEIEGIGTLRNPVKPEPTGC